MRLTTKYWIGIKHVGDSKMEPIVEELCVMDAVKRLVGFLSNVTLATRIEFMIARTEREIMQRLNPRGTTNSQHVFDNLDSMFADIIAAQTNGSLSEAS